MQSVLFPRAFHCWHALWSWWLRPEAAVEETREGQILSIIHWLSYRCRSILPVTTPHTEMVTALAVETSVHVRWARHVARSDGIRCAHKIVDRKHSGTIPPNVQKRRSGNFNISRPGHRYSLTVSFWNHSCLKEECIYFKLLYCCLRIKYIIVV